MHQKTQAVRQSDRFETKLQLRRTYLEEIMRVNNKLSVINILHSMQTLTLTSSFLVHFQFYL